MNKGEQGRRCYHKMSSQFKMLDETIAISIQQPSLTFMSNLIGMIFFIKLY